MVLPTGCVVLPIGAAESVAQLSAQLSEAQEQMVCAALRIQHTTPERSQKARMLEVRQPVSGLQLSQLHGDNILNRLNTLPAY
jgi:hypothetical protein